MISIEDIKKQLQNINGGSKFANKSEIKQLPTVLTDGEVIEAIAKGRYSKQLGLIIVTSKRVIFTFKNLFNSRIEDFLFEKITSVQSQRKPPLMLGEITIFGFGNTAIIDNMDIDDAQRISDLIRTRISSVEGNSPKTTGLNSDDVISQLERLGKLKEQNLITEEEFNEQKKKLLGQK